MIHVELNIHNRGKLKSKKTVFYQVLRSGKGKFAVAGNRPF